MKRKSLLWITLFPLFLLQGCGGGVINIKSTDGSEISFKKEDVYCELKSSPVDLGRSWVDCVANGVRTDLVGNQYSFSEEQLCWDERGFIFERSIVCNAAQGFGLTSDYDPNGYNIRLGYK